MNNNNRIESESDEAQEEEVNIVDDSQDAGSEDDSGEDLINDDMEADYRPNPELDRYEAEGIDDEGDEEPMMNYEQRRRAEAEIDRRNRHRVVDRRIPAALQDLNEDSEIFPDRFERNVIEMEDRDEDESDILDEEKYLNLEECRGRLIEWIQEERTQKWIKKTFKAFLNTFKKGEEIYYRGKIREMCQQNRQSLEVVYLDIVSFNNVIAYWIAEEPKIIFPYLNEVANQVCNTYFTQYRNIHSEIFVRFLSLPVNDKIRDLRYKHLDKLVRVEGVITRRSAVYQQMKQIMFICKKCGQKKGPFFLENNDSIKPGLCINCQSTGPFDLSKDDLVYRNFQKITLQESPGSVPAGRVPRQKEVIVLADQIDMARPGDEVEVTGVYTSRYDYALNVKHGFPLYYTLIECNHIKRKEESVSLNLDKAAIEQIKALSLDPHIDRRIFNSVAPSIYGHENVKKAIALAMFGGVRKDVQGKHRIRGDINVLVLGDPGTAKSQFLKNVEKTFYRSVYTTGKGASAVGLTASVRRDFMTNEWVLEGGALVLADQGICLIDEFDKMNEHDRTSIHEAMEQQSISISKAGIVTTLHARCSVIAAANPVGGKYDSQISFHDNVDLTDPILSRFDILCVVKDEVQRSKDEMLADFVINSHIKNHPHNRHDLKQGGEQAAEVHRIMLPVNQQTNVDVIPQEQLRKYILYARERVNPKLTGIDRDRIVNFYSQLRAEAEMCGGINIAIRHLESIVRMSEAHARIHLREQVTDHDVSVAITVLLESFLQSQKYSVAKQLRRKFSSYLSHKDDVFPLMLQQIDRLYRQQQQYYIHTRNQDQLIRLNIEVVNRELKQYNIVLTKDFIESELFSRSYVLQGDYIIKL